MQALLRVPCALGPSTVFLSNTEKDGPSGQARTTHSNSQHGVPICSRKGGALGASLRGMGQARSISTVKLELPELPYSYRWSMSCSSAMQQAPLLRPACHFCLGMAKQIEALPCRCSGSML